MMKSEETETVAALYAKHVAGLPHAKIESYVLHWKIADVVHRRIPAATEPAFLCQEFLRQHSGSEIICAAALKRLAACLTEQNQRAVRREDGCSEELEMTQEETQSEGETGEDGSERTALNQEETELVFETMMRHGQSKSVQLLGCELMGNFCHRATVDSSRGAQVMMNAVSNFPEDEQVQVSIWTDLLGRVREWHKNEDHDHLRGLLRRYMVFAAHLATHNALPLGYATMDRFTQNFQICWRVLDVMYLLIKLGATHKKREMFLAFVRENPDIHALFQRVKQTHARKPVHSLSTSIQELLGFYLD